MYTKDVYESGGESVFKVYEFAGDLLAKQISWKSEVYESGGAFLGVSSINRPAARNSWRLAQCSMLNAPGSCSILHTP